MTPCLEFTRWLDEGRPGTAVRAMQAHAAECPRCTTALRAALELEEALAVPAPASASAPAGFTAGVMRRVRARRAAYQPMRLLGTPPLLSWWVRAAADPIVVIAFALTAVLVWQRARLWTVAAALAARLAAYGELTLRLPGSAALTFQTPPVLHAFADPTVLLGLAFAALPAALWCSWQLYRWSEHAFAGALTRRAH